MRDAYGRIVQTIERHKQAGGTERAVTRDASGRITGTATTRPNAGGSARTEYRDASGRITGTHPAHHGNLVPDHLPRCQWADDRQRRHPDRQRLRHHDPLSGRLGAPHRQFGLQRQSVGVAHCHSARCLSVALALEMPKCRECDASNGDEEVGPN